LLEPDYCGGLSLSSSIVPFADNAGLGDRMLISRCVVY
jgi:hypothetical protein